MIGKILKTMRKSSNFSQSDLAKRIGYARNTLSQYETETIQPDFETIEKIANLCGYEIIFQNNQTKDVLTSKNIERKEL